MLLRPIKYIIGRKADDQKDFKIVQGTRLEDIKQPLSWHVDKEKINQGWAEKVNAV